MNMNGPNNLMAALVGELPLGWFLFKARGPMADDADRFNILNFTIKKKVEVGANRVVLKRRKRRTTPMTLLLVLVTVVMGWQ